MISPLPYTNRLEYLINTKLQTKIPNDLTHDINCTLHNYAIHSEKVLHKEVEYWRDLYFQKVNENNR